MGDFHRPMSEPLVGIDLGTSTSAVATVEEGIPRSELSERV